MRRVTWGLLLIFVFAIPWEYSLELGPPLGNIARVVGLVLLLVAVPAVFLGRQVRTPGVFHWVVVALYLWFCCTYFWTIEPQETLAKLRGYFQEMMIVWVVWEFAESPADLRALLRAWLAGSWVLAVLTVTDIASSAADAASQIRFAAVGHDANDVARSLVFGFPIAAFLLDGEEHWSGRLLALGYFPLGLAGVLLTGSRSGLLAGTVASAGSALLLLRNDIRRALVGVVALPLIGGVLWFVIPHETLERLGTIAEQLGSGDLNQRLNIWVAGWSACVEAPLLGHGAGSFVSAAGLAPIDTAHNTALSILVEGGLCALFLAAAIVVISARSIVATKGSLRIALLTLLLTWILSSLANTVGENRTTWLLLGVIALAGRLSAEEPEFLQVTLPLPSPSAGLRTPGIVK
jgi:hypothetical protein